MREQAPYLCRLLSHLLLVGRHGKDAVVEHSTRSRAVQCQPEEIESELIRITKTPETSRKSRYKGVIPGLTKMFPRKQRTLGNKEM